MQLLEVALAKRPDDRIGNAAELLRQLEVTNHEGLRRIVNLVVIKVLAEQCVCSKKFM